MLDVVCSVVWMWNMDAEERRNSALEFFGNVVLEEDVEDKLEREINKWKCIAISWGITKPCGYDFPQKEKLVRSYYEGRRTSKKCYRGKAGGKRSRGRKRIMILDEFFKGTTFETLKRRAQERDVWWSWTTWTFQLTEYWRRRRMLYTKHALHW